MAEPRPLVSTVIPAYRCEPYLGEAIESVLADGAANHQVVVVIDGGSDRLHEIAAGFAPRGVETVRHQVRMGIGAARNSGLRAARGDYVSFLDGDDLRRPGHGAALLAALDRHPEADLAFGHVRHFLCPLLSPEQRDRLRLPESEMPALIAGGMMARRAVFDRVGLFDPDQETAEFVDWYMRARDAGVKSATIADVVFERRIHGDNHSLHNRNQRMGYALAVKRSLDRRRSERA